ncbi:retinoschisin-like [Asterias amurensis]|uniref:retinoschisin-like n=1 Tax=Asterias amurensis TaxID=7602 RepID=UPI003AB79E35
MARVSSWIFLLLEIFLEASASDSVSGLCRVVSYQPVEHHALLGRSFMNISGISAIRCSARCLSHHGCFSFNYDHINKVCQMNNASAEHVSESFQGMRYFSYYDATAKPMTCQNTSSLSCNGKCAPIKVCGFFEKLGLEDGSIPDESLSASSNWERQGGYKGVSTPGGGRLNKIPPDSSTIGAWQPSVADTNQWIQVDFGNPIYVTGVLTQGRWQHVQWVTKYKVQFEPPSPAHLVDVKDQLDQTQIFNGNTDNNGIVDRRFFEPVLAVKIRIVPVEWNNFIALRFELLGCK